MHVAQEEKIGEGLVKNVSFLTLIVKDAVNG